MKKEQTKAVALTDELRKKIELLIHKGKYLLNEMKEAEEDSHQHYFCTPDDEFLSAGEAARAYGVFMDISYAIDDLHSSVSKLRKILSDNEVKA